MTDIEPPEGWQWGIGERSSGYYDYWCYHDQYELHMYWDGYDEHYVEVYQYDPEKPEDERLDEFPVETAVCKTEEQALEVARILMEKFNRESFC